MDLDLFFPCVFLFIIGLAVFVVGIPQMLTIAIMGTVFILVRVLIKRHN